MLKGNGITSRTEITFTDPLGHVRDGEDANPKQPHRPVTREALLLRNGGSQSQVSLGAS